MDVEVAEAVAKLTTALRNAGHKKATLALRSVDTAFAVEWSKQGAAPAEPVAPVESVAPAEPL